MYDLRKTDIDKKKQEPIQANATDK
jgi:hypothetical protein